MRKKTLHLILLLLSFIYLFPTNAVAALEKNITIDGNERLYRVYYPKDYSVTNEKPYDILLVLHPNGFTIDDFASVTNPQGISDFNNVLVVYPQAMDEQDKEINSIASMITEAGFEVPGFSTTSVWNAGASISADVIKEMVGSSYAFMLNLLIPNIMSKGKMVFNETINDVKFIDEMVNKLITEENANKDGLYVVGASMGGAMTYKYAFQSQYPVKSIAVINGFVGKEISIPESISFPICVFHSLGDSVVNFNGGPINDAIDVTVEKLTQSVGFSGEVKKLEIEDIAEDGNKIELTIHDDKTHPKVHLFLSDNATHYDIFTSNYKNGPNDIDHIIECGKFFWGEKFGLGVDDIRNIITLSLYPNPAEDYIYSPISGNFEIYNLQGALIMQGECNDKNINISNLLSGNYIVKIVNTEGTYLGKLVKK